MLGDIAIIPSAPLLVPELTGPGAAAELAGLRAAVDTAAGVLGPHWVAVCAGAVDAVIGPDAAGDLAGFGAALPVRLSPAAADPVDLPLGALLTGWLRGRISPAAAVPVTVCVDPASAVATGAALRARLDADPRRVGVLVLADGAHTLTPAAPGGHRPEDTAVQAALDDALAAGAGGALADLPAPIVGRAALAALSGLAGAAPAAATELYRGAPYGVGYFVGVWRC